MSRIPRRRWIGFTAIAALVCIIDLVTKSWIFAWPELHGGAVEWLWTGHVGIQKSLNAGALFGIGQGAVALFAAISIFAAFAIPIWLFLYRAAQDRLLTFAMALVMGGILGNLYDRLGLHQLDWKEFDPSKAGQRAYAVRDWILCQWNDSYRWPNFNIADAMLVCGACLLFWHALFVAKPEPAETQENGNASGSRIQ